MHLQSISYLYIDPFIIHQSIIIIYCFILYVYPSVVYCSAYAYIHALIFLYPISCNDHVISCVGKDRGDDLYSCRDDTQSFSGARLQIRQVVAMIASIHLYIHISIHTYIYAYIIMVLLQCIMIHTQYDLSIYKLIMSGFYYYCLLK